MKNGMAFFVPQYYIPINMSENTGGQTQCLMMDLIPYPHLGEHLRATKKIGTLATRVHLLFSLTSALRYLRDYKIVHLDLKPNNIMLSGNLIVRIIDFG
jgi:serine/threonine protein kinase